MSGHVMIKVSTQIIHHFIFKGEIWIVAKIAGEPMLWKESDVKEPVLRD